MRIIKAGIDQFETKVDCSRCGAIFTVVPRECKRLDHEKAFINCPCYRHTVYFKAPGWFINELE